MPHSPIIIVFLVLIGCLLLSAVIAVVYTLTKSLVLWTILRRKYPKSIEDFDVSGWNTFRAMKLINSQICDDDPEILYLKKSIRSAQRIALLSILICFLSLIVLGMYTYWYGSVS